MKSNLLLLGICCGMVCFAQEQAGGARRTQAIGPEAVWQPGNDFMKMVHEQCAKEHFPSYGDCLIAKLPAAGASQEAVAFSKLLEEQSHGQIGFMTAFRETGRVDVASVYYPLRANENSGCLLINGEPLVLDIDDLNRLPQDQMKKDPAYAALLKEYPRATLFPGARSDTTCSTVQKVPDGGERFVAGYYIQNGCHACERLGLASFAFDFNASGQFQAARFLGIEPVAKHSKR